MRSEEARSDSAKPPDPAIIIYEFVKNYVIRCDGKKWHASGHVSRWLLCSIYLVLVNIQIDHFIDQK